MMLFLPLNWFSKLIWKRENNEERNEKLNNEEVLIVDNPKKKNYRAYIFIFPSLCDVFATILDCIGLIFVFFFLFFFIL